MFLRKKKQLSHSTTRKLNIYVNLSIDYLGFSKTMLDLSFCLYAINKREYQNHGVAIEFYVISMINFLVRNDGEFANHIINPFFQ